MLNTPSTDTSEPSEHLLPKLALKIALGLATIILAFLAWTNARLINYCWQYASQEFKGAQGYKTLWVQIGEDTTVEEAGKVISKCGAEALQVPLFIYINGGRILLARYTNYPSSPLIQTWHPIHSAFVEAKELPGRPISDLSAPGWVGVAVQVLPSSYRITNGEHIIELAEAFSVVNAVLDLAKESGTPFVATYAGDGIPFRKVLTLWDELERKGVANKSLFRMPQMPNARPKVSDKPMTLPQGNTPP